MSMKTIIQSLVRKLLPLAVLAIAIAIAVYFVKTKPRPQQKPYEEHATLVEVQSLQAASTQLTMIAHGSVIPARQISLQARVSGEIIAINDQFQPGGQFSAGETLLEIDPSDYQVQLAAAQASEAQAELAYRSELGMQDIAQHEWELLDNREGASDLERELVLRKPHLEQAEANLNSAQQTVRKAELDLERCILKAPFNAIVLSRNVNLGAQVSSQTALATLVGTDEYWVNITLPVDDLQWLHLPDAAGHNGSPAQVKLTGDNDSNAEWSGRIIRLKPALEQGGRLAELLVAIPQPMQQNSGKSPLLLNTYVEVNLTGKRIDQAFILPRGLIHDGNTVWLCNDENRLTILEVDIIWSDRDTSIIRDGLKDGERIVLSGLPFAADGMLLDPAPTASIQPGE